MGRPEASVENYLRDQVKHHGGQIRKVRWISRNGCPDRYVWWDSGRYGWIECKAPGEQVDWRSEQGREVRRMRGDGLRVFIVSSREEVDAAIAEVKGVF